MQFGMDVFLGLFFLGNDHKSPVVRMGCAGDQGDEPISPLGCQAGLGAGSFSARNGHLRVHAGCGDRNVVHEHLVTGGAVHLLYSAFYTGKHI